MMPSSATVRISPPFFTCHPREVARCLSQNPYRCSSFSGRRPSGEMIEMNVNPYYPERELSRGKTAFLYDLDGTLVDSVYQHVLAWREALEAGGIHLAVWRIHRQIGMSGGLFVNALLRETGYGVSAEEAERLQRIHAEAYRSYVFAGVPGSDQLFSICCNRWWNGRAG